ncbi:MAG TPA: CorA family divalent cation transporter, partial [Clostridiaceae bacterium]|nr:CorA family divalent cation transporter [Clostridiaceae bacterium]
TPATEFYIKDVYDHIIQIIDTTETYRELLAGLMDLHLSNISYRMNEVMKVLTIISTIFIPLTFIAGVYGMNFVYMPELRSRWGYPLTWLVMVVIAAGMIRYFKKKEWF